MSHHFDTTTALEDPRINVCDFYLFRGRPGFVTMALTVNPNAGVKAPETFHEEGLYAFRFDLDGDNREEVTFKVRFGEAGHDPGGAHVQTYEIVRAAGEDAAQGAGGEVIASGRTGRVETGASGVRSFAGLAPELFAANRGGLQKFRAELAEGRFDHDAFLDGSNYFGNRNVTAIVLEVPVDLVSEDGAAVHAWATASLYGHAPEVQVSRWGLPLMTHIYILDPEEKETYNRVRPSEEAPHFSEIVAATVRKMTTLAGSVEDTDAYAERVAAKLFPTTLPYVLNSPAAFDLVGFNGRALTDNVMNVMLTLMTSAPIDNGVAVGRDHVVDTFPYFGAPIAEPVKD